MAALSRPTHGTSEGVVVRFPTCSSGMPGADGNEDTGYVHSVYRSGDQIVSIFGHHTYDFMHLHFYLIILSTAEHPSNHPKPLRRMLCKLLQLARGN
jgi:hypothetical protein